jgi:hypothetical protein
MNIFSVLEPQLDCGSVHLFGRTKLFRQCASEIGSVVELITEIRSLDAGKINTVAWNRTCI